MGFGASASAGTATDSIGYGYSDAGDLLSLAHTTNDSRYSPSYSFLYTGAHQVNSETIDRNAFIWDPSNAGTTTYTANNLNQYATVTNYAVGGPAGCDGQQHQLSYDCKGNLIWSGGSAAQWTYTYDAENRLRTATDNDGSVAASYWYDPLGRRTYKLGTGVTQRYFLNDGDDEIAEYDGNKNVVALYVPGPAIDEPIAMVTPNGSGWTHEFFHTNHQGSVIMMTNDNGGIVEGPFTYSPFGSCSNSAGHACPTGVPYRFTGRRWDDETGLLYFRARYYFVALGRFLQTDPPGYAADMNLYTYVGNDPTNTTDPMGDCPWCLAMAVGAGSGAVIDVGLQLYENGGDINNISGREVLTAAAFGGGLSLLGPTGGLLGRGGTRAAEYGFGKSAGLLNKGKQLRVGWGWSEKKAASVLRAAGKWVEELTGKAHVDVPGVAVKGAASPVRDGLVSGAAGAAGAHEAQPQSTSTPNASSNPPKGSGWSALAGQTVRAQGTRICPTDSSGERPNSC